MAGEQSCFVNEPQATKAACLVLNTDTPNAISNIFQFIFLKRNDSSIFGNEIFFSTFISTSSPFNSHSTLPQKNTDFHSNQ